MTESVIDAKRPDPDGGNGLLRCRERGGRKRGVVERKEESEEREGVAVEFAVGGEREMSRGGRRRRAAYTQAASLSG